jgi:hypothetical protein
MAALTAALVNSGPVKAYCQRLEQFSRAALLKLGLDGQGFAPTTAEAAAGITAGGIAAQALQMAVDGYTTFQLLGQTETNDTVTTFNLSDQLVDFLTANTIRRVDLEAYITADADAGLLLRKAMVAGGATPLVGLTDITFGTDAATATKEGGNLVSVARGDFLGSSLIVPDVKVEQSGNKVRLSITGITNIDMFWQVRVLVYPLIAQTLPVTD